MNQFYIICVSIGSFLRIKDAGFAKGFPINWIDENLIYDVFCIDSKSFLIAHPFQTYPSVLVTKKRYDNPPSALVTPKRSYLFEAWGEIFLSWSIQLDSPLY